MKSGYFIAKNFYSSELSVANGRIHPTDNHFHPHKRDGYLPIRLFRSPPPLFLTAPVLLPSSAR